MIVYFRNIILCLLFVLLLIQFVPVKFKHPMKFTTGINFIEEFPDIDPAKCIKTCILNEGK